VGAPQFFAAPTELTPERAVVRGDDAHHAAKVLRLRVGEPVLVADGRGRVAEAVTTAVAPGELHAAVRRIRYDTPPRPALSVVVGLLKSTRLELAVQKLTELGVARILPAACERSVVRWDPRKAAAGVERWRAIAHGAAKQSRRPRVPAVDPVAPLADQVNHAGGGLVLVCHEGSGRPLRATLPPEPPESLTVVVGPEGGLTDPEVAACAAAGGIDVSLGQGILRAETAVIAVTAALGFHYGFLG
jgi:16S rRNA (uracil1498-N3)-methyltransferase